MGVVVLDSDVLIGFLNRSDAHHEAARARIVEDYRAGERLLACATTYSEVLIGPLRAGRADEADGALAGIGVEVVPVDRALARRMAAVRLLTRLRLPDAFVIGTAMEAEGRSGDPIRVASFDEKVLRVFAAVRDPPFQ